MRSSLRTTALVFTFSFTFISIGVFMGVLPARASGIRETVDLGAAFPSPIPGHIVGEGIPTRIDSRCFPLSFRVNRTADPVPNPLGESFLSIDQATVALRQAAEVWNRVPTSFVELRIEGASNNAGTARLDMVNEITFRRVPNFRPQFPSGVYTREGTPIANARVTMLLQDLFFSDGLDLDGDLDSDVSAAIVTCGDPDGDGDIEYPAGLYEAGTLLDFDLVFNSGLIPGGMAPMEGFRFTTDPAAVDVDPRSVDLMGIAVHVFGLVQGLAQSPTSQRSAADGRSATLFPSVDTADPAAELALRSLDIDAIATTSFHYPEGSASSGPAALQPGDVAFDDAFGVIAGELFFGARGEPMVGATIFAVDHFTGEVAGTAVSGKAQFSVTPNGQNLRFVDAAFHVFDGTYQLVVPPGLYRVGIEPVDGAPIGFFQINLQSILAANIGQNLFHEEFWNGQQEGALERRPGEASIIRVDAGERVSGIDIVSNRTIDIANFGSLDSTGSPGGAGGSYYAVRIPADQFTAADAQAGGRAILQGAELFTATADDTVVPVFAEALLTTGRMQADGTAVLDLKRPLARQRPFTGQDSDFTPWWFDDAVGLAERVRQAIQKGEIESLFLVLRLPDQTPFPGISGVPPQIGLDGGRPDNDVPIHGLSYASPDGRVFTPSLDYNFLFRLILSDD